MSDMIVSKDRYSTTVEVEEYYQKNKMYLSFLIDQGKSPSIGDIKDALEKELEFSVTLTDISPYLLFIPEISQPKGVRYLRVVRTAKDYTYRPINKI